ncbi:YlbF family regulator [Halanaerobiaceae bacterium Z-7014]|uniref:YlbF family regulator n=1 Tax=Halonatronomonas betaini TaxID=2778430 RepID=A0A931AU40_9FIRM|nr:YlbF family regulator [Halonatronomonas betaini]MBF8436505.1 YlbF family regulator [Halonatronomonas betaini]
MSVYNLSHRLAKAIKDSDEYKNFKEAREEIKQKDKSIDILKEYQNLAWKINYFESQDKDVPEEDQNRIEELQNLVQMNNHVKKYLEARARFSTMINDIEDILFGDLEIGLDLEDDEEEDE